MNAPSLPPFIQSLADPGHDADPAETAEWREAFAALVQSQGAPRARFLAA